MPSYHFRVAVRERVRWAHSYEKGSQARGKMRPIGVAGIVAGMEEDGGCGQTMIVGLGWHCDTKYCDEGVGGILQIIKKGRVCTPACGGRASRCLALTSSWMGEGEAWRGQDYRSKGGLDNFNRGTRVGQGGSNLKTATE